MAKIIKITGYLVTLDDSLDEQEIALAAKEILGSKFNCIEKPFTAQTAEIGEWHDDHELNYTFCPVSDCEKYFTEDYELPAKIYHFREKYDFLSNMYKLSTPISLLFPDMSHALEFTCAEAAYQAYRCADPADRYKFVNIDGPAAKTLSHNIKARSNWDAIKTKCMKHVISEKFKNNPDLAARLLDTGNADLINENAQNDCFWGVCGGEGENMLGKILMEERFELKRKNWEDSMQ